MATKILHTADLHLRKHKDQRWKTLQKLIEIGGKEKIDVFVISGDLFDKGIGAEKLRPKIRELFSGGDFKTLIIPGNHDQDSYKAGLYFGEGVKILDDPLDPFEINDTRIVGMPFEQVEGAKLIDKIRILKDRVLKGDKANVLLYHGELLDAFFSRRDFGDEGEKRYMPVSLSYFDDLDIDYVLAGHFHSNFKVRELKNGGYFVYPGSPVSITKRETGSRKVNIFELGNPPREYSLNTPYFEEVSIELDPFASRKPLKALTSALKDLPSQASPILDIKGFVNSEAIEMSETELVKRIKKQVKEICGEGHYEFKDMELRDVQRVLEDDLFKDFKQNLEKGDHGREREKQIRNMVIKAMMKSKL